MLFIRYLQLAMQNAVTKTTSAQASQSPPNPFSLLAPEVVQHILRFLPDLPSRMAASGVCRLWRGLVDWDDVNHLHLDFALTKITQVPMKMVKWPKALESLLPMVDLTSLQVTLPDKLPAEVKKPGLHLPWPLYLLDCGVVVNQLTNQQEVSLSSITHVRISGRPDNPQFEFSCRLLELCASLTALDLSLTNDKFDLVILDSALTNKPLVELSINVDRLKVTGSCSSADLGQLCRVLSPGTLKSLTLVTGNRPTMENQVTVVFCFDNWCRALEGETKALSAVEELFIGASHSCSRHFLLSVCLRSTTEWSKSASMAARCSLQQDSCTTVTRWQKYRVLHASDVSWSCK